MSTTLDPAAAAAPAADPAVPRAWQLLVLTAADAEALDAATARLATWLASHPEADLAAVAATLHRAAGPGHRRMLVAKDAADAAAALAARDPARVLTAPPPPAMSPVVFLFPGLGEQYVGMARGLYRSEPVFRAELDRCAELLRPHLATDLREVLYPPAAGKEAPAGSGGIDLRAMLLRAKEQGDAATRRLNRTELAQPAVFAIDYALGRLLLSWGVQPDGMIGHSLGEYAAACVAGILPLEGALALVARRARLIDALPPGAMLAVPLSDDELRPLLPEGAALAAVNAPNAVVAAGSGAAVAALEAELARRGVVSRRLATTHAFHSPMMEAVVEPFVEMLRGMALGEPALPVVSNVTGTWLTAAEARDPGYWARHLVGTVRFADGVRTLAGDPARVFLEVGPGQTLGAFARQCGATRQVVLPTLRQAYNRQPDTAFLLAALGRLWLAGVEVAWAGLFPGGVRPLPELPGSTA